MQRRFYIAILGVVWLIASGRSCDHAGSSDAEFREQKIASEADSLEADFSRDSLPEATLDAFTVAARMKLVDFFDYLRILNDTAAPEPFAVKAGEMIRQLFPNESSVVLFTGTGNAGKTRLTIGRILQRDPDATRFLRQVDISGTRATRPLQRTGNGIYTGELGFILEPVTSTGNTGKESATRSGTLRFMLLKHPKSFGKDTRMIWEVFLGEPV